MFSVFDTSSCSVWLWVQKAVWQIENGPNENEWVRLGDQSVSFSSISSGIYSASIPSKRPALHTGGDLWLRRFGKLTLLSDLWLVTLSLSPFLVLFPPKSPLRVQDKKDFLWFGSTSLIWVHFPPSTNPSKGREPPPSYRSPFPVLFLYLSVLALPSHLTRLMVTDCLLLPQSPFVFS